MRRGMKVERGNRQIECGLRHAKAFQALTRFFGLPQYLRLCILFELQLLRDPKFNEL